MKNNETIFTNIYENGIWGKDDDGFGYSGPGSELKNTIFYIIFLEQFLKCNKIKSVLDVGCGDWTFSKHINWKNIKYLGIDIVKNIIEKNKKKYSKKNIKFMSLDFIKSEAPKADLLICKDVLQHLNNEEIKLFIKKTKKFKYSLITNDLYSNSKLKTNAQISTGKYRPLDLTKKPFNVKGIKIFKFIASLDKTVTKEVLLLKN